MGVLIKRDNLPVWVAPALAGFAVGMNVIEAADIGALLSVVVGLFRVYQSIAEKGRAFGSRVAVGIGRTAIVTVFAVFIAVYAMNMLIGANIRGIAGTKQDEQTKAATLRFRHSMESAEKRNARPGDSESCSAAMSFLPARSNIGATSARTRPGIAIWPRMERDRCPCLSFVIPAAVFTSAP